MSSSPTPYRRAKRWLLISFVVYGVLVATHLGEFWPFSIYPMFSQGGNPWSRAIVRDVTAEPDSVAWDTLPLHDLPGDPFPVLAHGIDPIDLANFVSKTKTWNANRAAGLQQMFYDNTTDRRLLVLRVTGTLDDRDSVQVAFIPYALLAGEEIYLNPQLPRE